MQIALVTDSTSDVPEKYRQKYDINVVDAYVHFGNDTYTTENLSMEKFYELMENSTGERFPKTSQPSSQDFLEMYEKLRDEGYDHILSVHIGNEYAGTLNSANNAMGVVEGIDITLVDSHAVSAPLFICLVKARNMIDAGEDPTTIKTKIEELGGSLRGYFSLETMENLVKGGRIGQIRYRFGKLLNVKPILRIHEGAISSFDKVRGLDNSREKTYQYAVEKYSKDDTFYYIIAHCQAEKMAKEYQERIEKEFPFATGLIMEIGMAVSVHTGRNAFYIMTIDNDIVDLDL